MDERVVSFSCEGDKLCGILHQPRKPRRRGVLVVVGGPQYRVGSHRQFVLLARRLAEQGFPVMRFDCRGMGDSEGQPRSFEEIDLDIRVAIDAIFAQTDVDEVVIWGLCDAASAALFYASTDRRVSGLVLLNPWVRTEESLAETYVRHYYLSRLMSRNFWRKVFSSRYDVRESLGSFIANLGKMSGLSDVGAESGQISLPDRMASGLEHFEGSTLFILSGRDLTAKEFEQVSRNSKEWRQLLGREAVSVIHEPGADHTFSSAVLRDRVEDRTIQWLRSW